MPPVKKGYTFIEWQLNNEKYDFKEPVTKNITLKAIWKKIYTVSFDTDGGTQIMNQNVGYYEKITIPTEPTKDGYIFMEWQLNNKKYNLTSPVTKNINLKAKWYKKYNVGEIINIENEKFYVV